ncbi:T9SS type B sorting domain-containing protein [Flavobacteriaceae bacterium TP-CH-4]|uniref:T9SS type B sorting domain-containing protein n=1 Tax=Pelagihabitans pacificus TaxID=2696054 RepID=A0A967E4D6_9FLAO|nr:T9SS type B sorting domain-containing protein [Pelagihabitans pacificus]NHF58277.1 T9SS type B sorting domain-containing protein [Pelagihabitans pacificus]
MCKIKLFWLLVLSVGGLLFAQTDRDALMALYNATDGPNWLRNDNWGSMMPLDTWYGITTDAAGNVVDINLYDYVTPGGIFTGGGNNLNGTLPDELGDLPFLEGLAISGNPNLTGPLPDAIGNLGNLTQIFISNNALSGPIPETFGNLTNLMDARMGRNLFSGEIPGTFSNLINLERLILNSNQLGGTIPMFFGSLGNLDVLDLGENQFTGNIPPELGNLTALGWLDLGGNQLTGGIPNSLGNITGMDVFDVSDNQLTGTLPASLNQWTMLTIVDIANNSFEGDIPSFFFTGFAGTPSLYIDNNFFEFGDFEDEFAYYSSPSLTVFSDNPQGPVDDIQNVSICPGQEITLTTTVSGNANSYEWFFDGTPIPDSDTPNLVLSNPQNSDSGEYTCRVSSAIVTDLVLERNPITLNVDAGGGPTANPVDDLYACDTNSDGFAEFQIDLASIDAQVLGNQTGYPVSYFDEMGNPLALPNPYTSVTEGEQIITVRVGDDIGCSDETTFRLITVPVVPADQLPDASECNYTLPELSANNFYYTEPGGQGELLASGTIITNTQILYVYTETVVGNLVCFDENNFTVTVDPNNCQEIEPTTLPRFFTPNNDGNNDIWNISALTGSDIKVTIFNRFGQLLKQLDPNITEGWDGRYNGTELPSSDYWYRYTDPESGKTIKGHFTLKR